MRRLRPLDATFLGVFGLCWIVCFSLHVKEVIYGKLARVQLFVSVPDSADTYPVLLGFWPGSKARLSGLAVGDQLVGLGQAELRGVQPLGFLARAYEEATTDLHVRVSYVRAGQAAQAVVALDPFVSPWGIILMTAGWAVAGLLVYIRLPQSPPAQTFFFASFAYSINWCFFFGGSRVQTYAWAVVYFLSSLVMFPLILRTVLIFPEETASSNKWIFVCSWVFALRGLTAISWYFGFPFPHEVGMRATHILEIALVATLLAIFTRNFFRAGPLGRRQLKWVVYGLYIGTVPVLTATTLATFAPQLWWLQEASIGAVVLTPLCIFIAIVRFNLFDIDRLISATAAYTIVLGVLLAGALLFAPRLVQAISPLLGLSSGAGQLLFSGILVLLVIPGQAYLRPQIERFFFAEQYALEQGIADLLRTLPECADQNELFTHVGEQLYNLLRPESCVVYAHGGTTYTPVFVKGSMVAPVFEVRSGLWGAVQTRNDYGDEEEWRRSARVLLRPSERSLLDRLRVGFVLALGQSKPPPFFLLFGPKQSGDVYTATDSTRLKNVAKTVSQQLEHESVF